MEPIGPFNDANSTNFNETLDPLVTDCGSGEGNLTAYNQSVILCEQCYQGQSYLQYYSDSVNYTYCEHNFTHQVDPNHNFTFDPESWNHTDHNSSDHGN